MTKMRSVIAAMAAVSVICAANAVAFAESAEVGIGKTPIEVPDDVKDKLANEDNQTTIITGESSEDTNADDAAEPSDKDNADTGVESVAAVVGAVALAGAAVVISRKRA